MRVLLASCVVVLSLGLVNAQIDVFPQIVVGGGATTSVSVISRFGESCAMTARATLGGPAIEFPVRMYLSGSDPVEQTSLSFDLPAQGALQILLDSPDLPDPQTLSLVLIGNDCGNQFQSTVTYRIPAPGPAAGGAGGFTTFSTNSGVELRAENPDGNEFIHHNCINIEIAQGAGVGSGFAITAGGFIPGANMLRASTLDEDRELLYEEIRQLDMNQGRMARTFEEVFPDLDGAQTVELCLGLANPDGTPEERTPVSLWVTAINFATRDGSLELFRGTALSNNSSCTPTSTRGCLGAVGIEFFENAGLPLHVYQVSPTSAVAHSGNRNRPMASADLHMGADGGTYVGILNLNIPAGPPIIAQLLIVDGEAVNIPVMDVTKYKIP